MMLQVVNLSFSYGGSPLILKSIDFEIKPGAVLAVIGESGCGKSTLLKLIYGLLDADEGSVVWKSKPVLGPKNQLIPGNDNMKYLAQDFDLMVFTTVAENVGHFLSNVDWIKKQNRIDELLQVVELAEFKHTQVKNLSGGQMQRVALAKVLAQKPEVLLLDEPFSHIDNSRKNKLRRNLFAFIRRNQITTLIASHDNTDILSFADAILVLHEGKIVAFDSTLQVYNELKNKYVASLFDDCNDFEINSQTFFAYPHQLRVVDFSELKVRVKQTYYQGKNYLIEGLCGEKSIFFIHDNALSKDTILYLEVVKS